MDAESMAILMALIEKYRGIEIKKFQAIF